MNKPITWQQLLIVLLCLPLVAGLVMAFGMNIEDDTRRTGGYIIAVTLPLVVALTVWHLRAASRPDLHPDVLAAVVDPKGIFQAGNAAHFWLGTGQDGGTLVLTCLLQNLVDAETWVDVSLDPDKGGEFVGFVPPLSASLPPSGVVRADLRVPLRPPAKPALLRLTLGATARAKPGPRVRFARRQVISKKVSPALTAGLLLTGTVYAGGGTFLTVNLVPFHPSEPPANAPGRRAWELSPVWNVGDPADKRSLAAALAA